MKIVRCLCTAVWSIASLLYLSDASAQVYSSSIEHPYRIAANVSYLDLGGWQGMADVYQRMDASEPVPTVVFLHGGSAMGGTKDGMLFALLPYLERGWNVVNVEHRLAGVTLAPEAVRNVRCAIRWVHDNASMYGFDADRIVLSGASSGGWFAVAAALTRTEDGWDEVCPGSNEPTVAAVVNWFGNWDLADVLAGPNAQEYAPGWVRGYPDPMAVATALSPLPIDARNSPPVISIHGDADPVVPYSQSFRLHAALQDAGVSSELVTIPGGMHGGFPRPENARAFDAIFTFLSAQGL